MKILGSKTKLFSLGAPALSFSQEIHPDMSTVDKDLVNLLAEKIEEGEQLLKKLHLIHPHLDGNAKLERKIRAECKFLLKLKDRQHSLKKEQILSTNLSSLSSIMHILENCHKPVAVLKPFHIDNGTVPRIEVDVVSDDGGVWHKAIARKPEALDDISKGKSSCGQKSVLEQAKIYLECAKLHTHFFVPPKVVFCFTHGVSITLAKKLQKQGICVEGKLIEMDRDFNESDENTSSDSDEDYAASNLPNSSASLTHTVTNKMLFLDITCMVAYVSSMTNGGANFVFPRSIYNQQADWERKCSAKSKLDHLFDGKKLVTCNEALQDFKGLVDRMGGSGEKERAYALIARLQIVNDSPSDRVKNLKTTANIKMRSKLIFGTADRLGIAIVTANTGFVRSAFGQGVEIAYHPHEPRVLTEQQEVFSKPLSDLSIK